MAGRIPQSFIDEVLDRTDIVEVIDARVPLKKSGRSFKACCPFHNEKTPSFNVNPDKQFFYCFGCGAGGNALTFLMDYERLEFRAGVEQLAEKCGLEVPQESPQAAVEHAHAKNLYHVMQEADRFYRRELRQHSEANTAVAYLKQRGLSGEIAARFGVGFAPPGWDKLLKAHESDSATLQLLLEAGMLIAREGKAERLYDRFRHRIMFPIRDSRGRTIAFGGRVLDDSKPKYLNSPETSIFHKGRELYGLFEARQANAHLPRLLIVEGYMDVIALAQMGINYAVATLGTSTSTAHLRRLFRHCQDVVFCFDGDAAGAAAARRAMEASLPTMEDGRQVHFLFLPAGEDPDSLVRAEGAEAFTARMDSATPLSEYLFDIAAEGVDLSTADGKAAMSQQFIALSNQLPAGAFKEILLAELAQRTGLAADTIQTLAAASLETRAPAALTEPLPEAPVQEPPRPLPKRPARPPQRTASLSLSQAALSLLLYKPDLAQLQPELEPLRRLHDEDSKLLLEVFELLEKRPESSTGMLLGYWYGQEEGEKLAELCGRGIELLKEGAETLERSGRPASEFDERLTQQFQDTMDKLAQLAAKHRIDELLAQVRDYEQSGVTVDADLRTELKQLLDAQSSS